ncbi:unnamed protein product [Brassica napus]|uniref:(rape) hypothetical protein n=1 Tax=Brassica napus TaxID=3708 RepID=A0A816QF58_BRANA|nr:unnamed protein product [Brassica napus]
MESPLMANLNITAYKNGDHDYVEYNNSSTTSPCQDHSPWLSA